MLTSALLNVHSWDAFVLMRKSISRPACQPTVEDYFDSKLSRLAQPVTLICRRIRILSTFVMGFQKVLLLLMPLLISASALGSLD